MILDLQQEKALVFSPSAVALGFFDGVHIGHQAILARTAAMPGLTPLACTFLSHPKKERTLLTDNKQKQALLYQYGMKEVVFLHFDQIQALSPEAFVTQVLVGRLQAKALVCGYNYHFGQKATGDAATLGRLCEKYALHLEVVPEVTAGKPADGPAAFPPLAVSASRIRRLIEAGELRTANLLLGRPYAICEQVVYGKQLGRTIGIPTINQFPPAQAVLPAHGVYASRTLVAGRFYPSITNVGVRPTVDEDNIVNFETHIHGIDARLYGQCIRVELYDRIRGEKKFSSLAAMKEQIEKDIAVSETIFHAYVKENG